MWPFSSSEGTAGLTESDARRDDDGMLVCPRCESRASNVHTSTVGGVMRRHLSCANCGYHNRIADGVRVDGTPETAGDTDE